jgi:hypothetical protein
MKRRAGFVANSSSSSFVVALPRQLKLEFTTLQPYLYGPEDLNFNAQIYGRPEKFASSEITARILPQLQDQKPNTARAIEIWAHFLSGAPVEPALDPLIDRADNLTWLTEMGRAWAIYHKECLAYGRAHLSQLQEGSEKLVLYLFELDDFDMDDPLSDFICNDPRAFERVPHWRLRWG